MDEPTLQKRLADDITRFKENNPAISFNDEFIKNSTASKALFGIPDEHDYFTDYYLQKIQKIEDVKVQAQMWIARQKLVYDVFTAVVTKFPDKDDNIRQDLLKCNIGIFGSMKPSSDVDIGISPNESVFKIGDLIHYIENEVFIKEYGFSSLNIGIEYYASMLQYNEKYLLDVSDLDGKDGEYTTMVSLALAGVWRNLKKRDINAGVPIKKEIIKFLDDRLNGISKYLPEDAYDNVSPNTILEITNYTKKSEQYKDLANNAEAEFIELKKNPDAKNQRYKTIIALAYADLCREESYVLTPSVLHVVRILQGEEDETKRTARTSIDFDCQQKPSEFASCSIKGYGFLLSALEQYGYCKRYEVVKNVGDIAKKNEKDVVVEPSKDEPNAKKYEKYENRLMDALRRCVRPFKLDELSQSVIKEQTRCPPTISSDDQTASQINAIEITVTGADGTRLDTQTVPIKK